MDLIPFSDPLLKEIPMEFDFEKEDAKKISDDLTAAMLKLGGAGLSANQVGLDLAVFVMGGFGGIKTRAMFNPKIQSVSDEKVVMQEGCLSYPGLKLSLNRPAECAISYQDVDGNVVVDKLTGIEARVALHEYDHMMGVNFTMRASKIKLQRAMKKLDKKVKKYKRRMNGGL